MGRAFVLLLEKANDFGFWVHTYLMIGRTSVRAAQRLFALYCCD